MTHIDQLGREITLLRVPQRIVSLVPSQTELLITLGLLDSIVGVTKFCVHPASIRKEKTVVGGTKKVNYKKIKALHPDIILCNKEENTKEMVEYLQEEYQVHVSDISSVQEALEMITQYGEIFERKDKANTLIQAIRAEKESFTDFIKVNPKKRVAYLIWKDPLMAAGSHTFIDHLLKINGFINVFGYKNRYPEVSKEELRSIEDLDLILLSSEPYPFSEKHIEELKGINPDARIILVDGEYFSWYGSRLVHAFSYFKTLH